MKSSPSAVVIAFDDVERRLSAEDAAAVLPHVPEALAAELAAGGRVELDDARAAVLREALGDLEGGLSGRVRALVAALNGERFPED